MSILTRFYPARQAADRTNNRFRFKNTTKTRRFTVNSIPIGDRESFRDLITRSFIEGSGIPQELFNKLAEFVRDTEATIGGDVEYPIAEALNWKVPGRGQYWQPRRARENLESFLFRNADGTIWQGIISEPEIKDGVQKRPYKYLAPTGGGNRLYCPPVIDWQQVKDCTDVPIILTEGGKKTLAAVGQGYVAIGGYGCQCLANNEGINPDLLPYAVPGREFIIALDRDTKPKTVRLVNGAIRRLGKLLTDRGCVVRVAVWDAKVAKGLDDLLVAVGEQGFKDTIDRAIPFEDWVRNGRQAQARQRLGKVSNPDTILNTRLLSTAYQLPAAGDVCLISALGTGKTELVGEALKNWGGEVGFIGLFHRVSLATAAADRFGCDLINDLDRGGGFAFNTRHGREFAHDRVCGCIDSLWAMPIPNRAFFLFIDEISKVLEHLTIGRTCKEKRGLIIARLVEMMQSDRCIGVIAADADMSDREIDFIAAIRGERPTVVLNQYQEPRKIKIIDSPTEFHIIGEILRAAAEGTRLFVPCAQKSTAITIDAMLRAQGITTLLIHADTTGEVSQEFKANPDAYLAKHKPQVVIASPTIAEGLSITGAHFDRVYGVFQSRSIGDASVCQFLRRYRPNIPITIWVHQGSGIPRSIDQLKRIDKSIGTFCLRVLGFDRFPIQWEGLFTDLAYAYKADREYSLANLQACVIARLESQGYQVEVVKVPHDQETAKLVRGFQKAAKDKYQQDVAAARPISDAEALDIERRIKYGKATEQERLEVTRHILTKFYATFVINPDDVAFDQKGRTRSAILKGEFSLMADIAHNHDREKIEELQQNGGLPTDLPNATALNQAFRALRLDELLLRLIRDDFTYSQYDPLIKDIADRCRACADQVRALYGFDPKNKGESEIVGRILKAIGFKTQLRGHLTDPETKIKTRFYGIDREHLQQVAEILRRRHDRRVAEGFRGEHTTLFNLILYGWCDDRENPPDISPPPPKLPQPPPDRGESVAIT